MKFTRKYGDVEVTLDTKLMTGRQKMSLIIVVALGAALKKMHDMHDDIVKESKKED